MPEFSDILATLSRGTDLSRDQSRNAFLHIMSGNAVEAEIREFLTSLAHKGASVEEIVGAAIVMREKAVAIATGAGDVLDTCGTGGDVRHTFNISTAAAIIAAACGVKVVKHGNRSASGRAGSADVLEKLGVRLDVGPAEQAECLMECNICFAFARLSHPAMQFVAETRKSLGFATIFNLLGPLTNPGNATLHLLGVFSAEWTEKLAKVLAELGSRRAWVVHAEDGLDEISTLSPTRISELKDGSVRNWTLDTTTLGLGRPALADLQVGNVAEAAHALEHVLRNEPGPRLEIALVNAAAALVIAGRADDLAAAMDIARWAVSSGQARRTLDLLIAKQPRREEI